MSMVQDSEFSLVCRLSEVTLHGSILDQNVNDWESVTNKQTPHKAEKVQGTILRNVKQAEL